MATILDICKPCKHRIHERVALLPAVLMAPSSLTLLLLSLLTLTTSSSATTAGDDGDGLTHIHIYVHETYTGPNATAAAVLQSPLGANSSFGSIGVVDDELRAGPDRASPLLGRYQAVFFGTSLQAGAGYLSSVTLVFTAGEYAGSTLSVQGPVLGFAGTIERAVVGGTGRFRLARGYMLFKMVSKPTPETDGNEVHLFVLMHHGKY